MAWRPQKELPLAQREAPKAVSTSKSIQLQFDILKIMEVIRAVATLNSIVIRVIFHPAVTGVQVALSIENRIPYFPDHLNY